MAMEIERKFLVVASAWAQVAKGIGERYSQGYLQTAPEKTIRVRLTENSGFLTIKGESKGASRTEYEYPIPMEDARAMLATFCEQVISKRRYKILYEGMVWEVDEFMEDNAGLLLAEIELPAEDAPFNLPPWAGTEVTGIKAYYNSELSLHPYKRWKKNDRI